ncbi:hypothetical protein [Pueribacillus sp. YX66]|uniref:hypothetical protein n=1 Tax=Pueribacillus sp. YX66 TaxID=3229242 RepID=UPI00358D007B
MGKIGRSELCSCGSGKIDNECCSRNNVVSMYHFVQKDIEKLEQHLIAYTMNEFEFPFSQCMEEALMTIDVPEDTDVLEVVTLFVANWFVFSRPVLGGESVVDMFVDTFTHVVKRPLLKHSLPRWKEAKLNIYRIEHMVSGSRFTVRPLFGGDEIRVNIFEDDPLIAEGYLLLGVLIPIGDEYTFFTTFLDNQPKDEDELVRGLLRLMNDYGEDDFELFIEHYFPEVLHLFLFEDAVYSHDEMKWESESQKNVAEQFQRAMEDAGMLKSFIDLGIVLWYSFCQKRNPNIKNSMLYVATLHYIVEKVAFGEDVDLHLELVKEYGVSPHRLSATYREFEQVLKPELKELHDMIETM